MSAIRHPNIVQYLGTCQDPQTGLPVLLMELMDDSLTHFLESSQDAVPYHIQVNVCHNITLAISYLHSNGITHRDLSSNNVLLCGNVKAKVTDFGMAKLGDINPQANHVSFTMCPGTDAYMPPEAVNDPPAYTAKIDCFAIGTLIIQIVTKQFPKPGDRHKTVYTTDPQFPGGEVKVCVSEVERRQNQISLVDPNHPLLPIALHCLKDRDIERPSAQELCHRVGALKATPQFAESVRSVPQRPRNITEREEQIRELQQQVQEKDHIIREKEKIIVARQQECQQLRVNIRHKNQMIEEREEQIRHITRQHNSSHFFQTRIQELEQQQLNVKSPTEVQAKQHPSLTDPPQISHSDTSTRAVTRDSLALKWRGVKKATRKIHRAPSVILDGDTVHFRATDTRNIYAYKSTDKMLKRLPECQAEHCSLTVVNNLLTTIGGKGSGGKKTNQLFSLTGEGKSMRWEEVFKSMPTKRSSSVAVCTGQALIVVGGVDQVWKVLRTVEVMDLVTQEWSPAADLPESLCNASIAICHDRVYILGGWCDSGPTKSVYTCTLTDLFLSCRSRSLGERLAQSLSLTSSAKSTVWDKVADLPVTQSICVTLHGQLLAVGGIDYMDTPISDVCMYRPTSNTWEIISKMQISQRMCFAAVLPNNELIVVHVGGYTASSVNSETLSIEIAAVV